MSYCHHRDRPMAPSRRHRLNCSVELVDVVTLRYCNLQRLRYLNGKRWYSQTLDLGRLVQTGVAREVSINILDVENGIIRV
jgi:hypothetical protein